VSRGRRSRGGGEEDGPWTSSFAFWPMCLIESDAGCWLLGLTAALRALVAKRAAERSGGGAAARRATATVRGRAMGRAVAARKRVESMLELV